MKVELPLDRSRLVARVEALYALRVESLRFVPEGETSAAYAVSCVGGERRFLKLWPGSRQGLSQRARLETVLPLTRELFERGLVPGVVAPLPALSGALLNPFDEFGLALFPYVEGSPLPMDCAAWPPGLLEQAARAFVRLHQATGAVRSPLPSQPAFGMGFAADLRAGLDALSQITERDRPGLLRLRDLLLPRRAQLLGWLGEVEGLRDEAQRSAGPLVLCHTDLGGNNVLLDESGGLLILDWDEMLLAPAEHDLHEYRGPCFEHVLSCYYGLGGVRPLRALQFAYYLKRRYLADLTDWLVRIREENTREDQDASDLAGIEGYCLPYLERFPQEMEEIKAALARA